MNGRALRVIAKFETGVIVPGLAGHVERHGEFSAHAHGLRALTGEEERDRTRDLRAAAIDRAPGESERGAVDLGPREASLGFEDAVAGVVSLEGIKRREGGNFDWPDTMPRLPVARADIEAFRAAVRDFQDRTLKPFGAAVGKLLRSADNPRGAPDVVLERAGQDTLGVTTALVKPFTGRVVYAEDMAGGRYNFYAPQVWTRQRRIIMPAAEILGTHLCNAYEVTRMNDMVAAGTLDITEPTVVPWDGLPDAHQAMWDNRHSGATYIVNHALPAMGLRSKDELFEAWAAKVSGANLSLPLRREATRAVFGAAGGGNRSRRALSRCLADYPLPGRAKGRVSRLPPQGEDNKGRVHV